MPYELESPIAAGLGAASGYLSGVTQRKEKDAAAKRQAQQDAQAAAQIAAQQDLSRATLANTQGYQKATLAQGDQRLGIERANADTAAARAKAAADADERATVAAKRQAVIDAASDTALAATNSFAAKMQTPPGWQKMPPEAKVAYLEVRLSKASQLPYSTAKDKLMAQIAEQIKLYKPDPALAERIRHDRAIESRPQRTGRDPNQLTAGERLSEKHWNMTHNADGTLKRSTTADSTGLSAMGKLQYDKDVRDWMLHGQDPSTEPDPAGPKYQKKSAAQATSRSAGTTSSASDGLPKTRVNPANNKTYYLHPDGKYYLDPP